MDWQKSTTTKRKCIDENGSKHTSNRFRPEFVMVSLFLSRSPMILLSAFGLRFCSSHRRVIRLCLRFFLLPFISVLLFGFCCFFQSSSLRLVFASPFFFFWIRAMELRSCCRIYLKMKQCYFFGWFPYKHEPLTKYPMRDG